MTDAGVLYLILLLLYLSECLFWLPRGGVALFQPCGSKWLLREPPAATGNDRGSILCSSPFRPVGGALLFQLNWIAPSGEEVVIPSPDEEDVPWKDTALKPVSASGRDLVVDGQIAARAVSDVLAEATATFLRLWSAADGKDRSTLADELVRSRLDVEAARRKVVLFDTSTRALRAGCRLHFVFTLAAVPLVASMTGFSAIATFVFGGVIAANVAVAILFRGAHLTLYPEAVFQRWTQLLMVLVSPVAAIRSCDYLTRDLLGLFHPLVGAALYCDPPGFRETARRILLTQCPNDGTSPRERLAIERLLEQNGLNRNELLAPPEREGLHTLSFCPRCREQFTIARGNCASCNGMQLEMF